MSATLNSHTSLQESYIIPGRLTFYRLSLTSLKWKHHFSTQSEPEKVCILLAVQLWNPGAPWSVSPAGLLTALSAEESITADDHRGGYAAVGFKSGFLWLHWQSSPERRAPEKPTDWSHTVPRFHCASIIVSFVVCVHFVTRFFFFF